MPAKALMVINMLNDVIEESGALYCGESSRAIVAFIRQRLNASRTNKELRIYLQDAHDKNDKEVAKVLL